MNSLLIKMKKIHTKRKEKKNLEKIENAVAKGWLHSTTIKHNFDETFNPLCFTSVNCEILMWLVRFVS